MWRWVVVGLAALGLAVILAVRLIVHPSTGPTVPSDAVVLLAGDAHSRLPVALRLAESGPEVLVVSAAEGEDNAPARALCRDPGDLTVHCFVPERSDTRAEARELGRLVADHGWDRITVVTSAYHLPRAGMLVRRCTDASVELAAPGERMPVRRWINAIAHESAGLTVAVIDRSC
ncbi:YdcF family protein [Blastococcus sp. SYSU DS0973]